MRAGGFPTGLQGCGMDTGRGMPVEQRVGAGAEGCCRLLGGRAVPPGVLTEGCQWSAAHTPPAPSCPLLSPTPALDKIMGMEDDFGVTSAFPSGW